MEGVVLFTPVGVPKGLVLDVLNPVEDVLAALGPAEDVLEEVLLDEL